MFGLQLTSECWRCSLFMNRVQGHQVETTREPSRTEAGKLVTGNLSLVIGHLEGDTAKRRLRQSPITSDQLPVTSEPLLVQGPNARPELEVGAFHEPCPGSAGIPAGESCFVQTRRQDAGAPRFMVSTHVRILEVSAFHEPAGSLPRRRLRKIAGGKRVFERRPR